MPFSYNTNIFRTGEQTQCILNCDILLVLSVRKILAIFVASNISSPWNSRAGTFHLRRALIHSGALEVPTLCGPEALRR